MTVWLQVAIEVGVWMTNNFPVFYMDLITYPCPNSKAGSVDLS